MPSLFNPCIKSIGPPDAKLLIIGEAPGEQEERVGIPFIGSSGQEFDRMLEQAGIKRNECFLTNVLFTRPPSNKLEAFLVDRTTLTNILRTNSTDYTLPPLRQGKYLHPDLLPELSRLTSELLSVRPNLILCAGGTALWALLGTSSISKMRGSVQASKWGKLLPTLHPATVLYDWSNRPIILADLMKAKLEMDFPEIRRPVRHVVIDPTLEDIQAFEEVALAASLLSVDTETRNGSITCCGFAISSREAFVVPLLDYRKIGTWSYWSHDEEIKVRKIVARILDCPVPKLFQNGLYDLQYFIREGFKVRNCLHDTMILHHALYPELPKSLGFMGSVYTNESSWKLLRQRGDETFKREE